MELGTIKKIAVIAFIVLFVVGAATAAYYFFVVRDNEPTATNTTINLNWWGLWEEEATMQALIDRYKESNPNVNITYAKKDIHTYENGLETYKQSIIERTTDSNPTAPDIVTINNSWVPELEASLSPLPLTVYSPGEYQNIFYDVASKDCLGKDGQLYCIPIEFDGLALYYNKALLESKGYQAPSESWEDLVTQGIALTTYDDNGQVDISGLAFGTGTNVTHSSEIVTLLFLQRGQSVSSLLPGNGEYTVDISDAVGQEVFSFYSAAATQDGIWNETLASDKQRFIDGKLAMMFAPSWFVFNIKEVNPSLDFAITTPPQITNISNDKTNLADYWAWSVSKSSPNSDAAWDFLYYLSQPEQYQLLYNSAVKQREDRVFGRIYPRKDMAKELESVEYVAPFIEMADSATSVYVGNQHQYNSSLSEALDSMSSSTGSQSAKSAFTSFKESFTTTLSLY